MGRHLFPLIFMMAWSQAAFRSAITPFFPELMYRFGVGYTEMGVLFSLLVAANASFQVPMGLLADRYPPGRLLAGMMFVLAAAGLYFLLAASWGGALTARVLMGAASAIIFPACVKLVEQFVPSERRGAAMSNYEGGVAFAMFIVLAVLPVLAGPVGFVASQGTLVAMTLALGAWVLRAVPQEIKERSPAATAPGIAARARFDDSPYAHYGQTRRILFLALFAGCGLFAVSTILTWLPTYLQTALGGNLIAAGLMMGLVTGTYALVALGSGKLCDWFGRRLPIANLGNLCMSAGFIILAVWPGRGGLVALASVGFLLGIGSGLAIVPMIILVPTLFGRSRSGLTSGLMIVAGQSSVVLGSILVGYLVDLSGRFTTAWLICLAVLALRTAASFLIQERPIPVSALASPPPSAPQA